MKKSRLGKQRERNPFARSTKCFEIQKLESRLLLSISSPTTATPPFAVTTPSASDAVNSAPQLQPAASPAIPLSTSTWTAVGPADLSNGSSGRLSAVAGDPNNPNVLYLAAAGGGVWKTVDGGASWTPLTDSQSTLFMGALAVAPSNPNVIYAGTGEATNSGLSFYGRGVLKSTDGGVTWALMGNSVFDRKTISQMAVDPTNADILYVAIAGGGVNGLGGNTGIWKTSDGGKNWTNTTTAISASGEYSDVQLDPTNPQHLYCAVYNAGTASGVYVTTNGGSSWTMVSGGLPSGSALGNTKIALSPSNPQVLYVSFTSASTAGLLSLWSSTNGGTSWTQSTTAPNYMGSQGWYDSVLIVDRHNPNVVFAAGQAGTNSVIESTDGGQTWVDIHTGVNGGGPHADHHGFAFDANDHLIDGNDGGIWRLDIPTPGNIHWDDINSNLQLTQFIGGSLDPTNPNNAFAGSQDNGTEQFTGSLVWTTREGGDGGLAKIDQQNSSIVYHQAPTESFGTTNFFRKSTDGGVNWSAAVNGIGTSDPQDFYAPFFVDPNNGSHLFFGTNRIYESTDAAASWTPISTTNTNGWNTTSTVNTIAMAPSAPSTVYATAGGTLFVTTNDGATWTAENPFNGLAGAAADLLVDPSNSLVCYMVATNFGSPHVIKTVNGGTTWTDITGNLPDLPTYSIALNPAANTIYVGNDNGVYSSTDGGLTWSPYGYGIPNVEVRDLEYNSNLGILAAITHGRGMYEISTALGTPIVVNTTSDETNGGDGLTSLREAVAQANSAGGGIITFDPSISSGSIALSLGNISIGNNISINGPSSRSLTIIGGAGGALEIAGGAAATLANLLVSGSSTLLQVDSTGQALLQDVTVGGNVIDNGSLTFFQLINDTVSASISGGGSLTKTGPQTLTLSASNSYSGGTTVTYGTLSGNTNSLAGTITVNNPGTLDIAAAASLFNGTVSGTGTVRISGAAASVQMAATSSFANSGPTVIDAGASLIASATNDIGTNSTLYVDGVFDLGGFNQTIGTLMGGSTGAIYNSSTQSNLTATLTAGGSGINSEYDGLLENVPSGSGNGGKLAFVKNGTGMIILARPAASPNTFTGGTTLSAGTLYGNTSALDGSIADGSVLSFDQGLLSLSDGTFSGSISGSGTLNIVSGTVRLSSTSTLQNAGATTINGTLVGPASGGANAFSNLSAYTVNGVLDLGASSQAVGSLFGAGTIYHFQPPGQPTLVTLTLGGDNSNPLFSGIVENTVPASGNAGTLAINKVGAGTFTLSGANTFTGGLTVSAGTLGIGPSPTAADPMGGSIVTLNGGNLTLEGRIGTPVQQLIPANGYNQDIIAEAGAANALAGTTTTFDGNFVWYETGFPGSGSTGLPPNGTIFTSAFNPAVSFQLQSYTTSNVALIPGGNGTVTLTLNTPTAFEELNFLAAAANGSAGLTATLHFSDSTTATAQLAISDWFNGSQAAFTAGGRIIRSTTSTITLTSGNPRLYEYDYPVPVGDQARTLTSITFTETSGSDVGIYGLSGAASVVPATQSYPNTVQLLSSGTIDVENSLAAALGNLIMSAGSFNLTGPSGSNLTFGPVTMNVGSQFNTATGTNLSLGAITGGSNSLTKLGAGTLTLSGPDAYGNTTVSAGTLIANGSTSLPNTALSIGAAATVQLKQNPSAFTANISSLSISAGGKLDIGNNKMFINYGSNTDPIATIRGYLADGYNNGAWTGTSSGGNILSTRAAANAARTTAIGYADSADHLLAGQAANTIELMYTLYGDTTLSASVGFNDFTRMTQHWNQTTGGAWDTGDFNYDGSVNLADFTLMTRTYNTNLGSQAQPATAAVSSIGSGTSIPASPVHHHHVTSKHPRKRRR